MKFDIVIVTYNSEKWLNNCIKSIERQKVVNLKDINIYFVDNNSKDDTIEKLYKIKENSKLGSFNIIKNNKNLGFGNANNKGFYEGESEYVFFLNHDTELEEDTIFEMEKAINESSEEFAVWEFRQRPYEHPKFYDILTGETTWASGACFIIKREIFKNIKGFDNKIFMYAEDVDLSWKVRLNGYKIKYVPTANVKHYCYLEAGQIKPRQYINSIINNLNLRIKYGNYKDIIKGIYYIIKILKKRGPYNRSRKQLICGLLKNIKHIPYFSLWRFKNNQNNKFKEFTPIFIGFDYERIREGAFFNNETIKENPLVSIIVRTCGRPEVLKETLISLQKQTYKNFEVVIVEDGLNISEEMIKKDFSDLKIKYYFTGEKKGRCFVGNIGMEKASGKYLNFLDDDDLFFADHIETLVKGLIINSDYKIAYTDSYESQIEIISIKPEYKYIEHKLFLAHNRQFSRIKLLDMNLFPIQAVMFEKNIYNKYGGFDITLDNLEDWEMWARYAMENRFLHIPKGTSIYRVPYSEEKYKKRQSELDSYYNTARDKILKNIIIIKPEELLEELRNT